MAKKPKVITSTIESAELQPPRFEDFLKPNPFIYPWMLRFLPEQHRAQDLVFVGIGCALFFFVFIVLYEIGFGEIVSVGVGISGIGILVGESEARHIIAGMKFGQAKKQSQQ